MDEKELFYGKTLDEIKSVTDNLGLPKFTAKQITEWLYKKNCSSFEEMTNLSKVARAALEEGYTLGLFPPEKESISKDKTKKYLFPCGENRHVEAAYIPEETRATLCVSTQSGCRMNCSFCMTARQGLQGQLTTTEILNQYRSLPERERISNLVYMGMGEPLDNLDATLKSLEILTADYGYAMSPTRITVSTIGVLPALETFLEKSKAHLAVSLHNPFEEERIELVPASKAWPISKLFAVLKTENWRSQRRLTFEYIMLKGINDQPRHARKLMELTRTLHCRVNLLHYHSLPDSKLQGSDEKTILNFQKLLNQSSLQVNIRKSRGEDINAACGLLSTREREK